MGTLLRGVSRGQTYAGYSDLEIEVCGDCGVLFALPQALVTWARDRGDAFWCPNGHRLTYAKTEAQKLAAQLERERARSGRLASERDQLQASLRAQKGAATRARNEKARLIARVANGVCPCCNRTFKQLAAHMARQHPQFIDETEVAADAETV